MLEEATDTLEVTDLNMRAPHCYPDHLVTCYYMGYT